MNLYRNEDVIKKIETEKKKKGRTKLKIVGVTLKDVEAKEKEEKKQQEEKNKKTVKE